MNNKKERPQLIRVYQNKFTGQKLCTVPKSLGVEVGDYVIVKKAEINVKS